MTTMRVGPKGQVVIPQAVRRELGIGPGDEVLVEEHEGGALVRKVPPAADLLGLLADGPGSVGMADFEEQKRREREREDERSLALTKVLDAWAVEAMLRHEPAGPRVKAEIEAGGAVMSWINLGEVLYVELRRVGRVRASEAIAAVRRQVTIEAPDGDLVMAAARFKAAGGVSYADCFGMATAQRYRAPLLTGDSEILAFADQIDVIDVRPGP